ncbi:hypothetical protein V6C21_05375 [[Clostridium] cellulosi]
MDLHQREKLHNSPTIRVNENGIAVELAFSVYRNILKETIKNQLKIFISLAAF